MNDDRADREPLDPTLQGAATHPIGVFIVEDDDDLRTDFSRAVGASRALRLLGATGSARQALQALKFGLRPDVLLVDLGLPDGDGTDVIRAMRQLAPQAHALVISVFADDQRVLDALSAGAQGYLLKDATDEDLVRGIQEVARGDAPLSPQVARYLLRAFEPHAPHLPTPAGEHGGRPTAQERLTPREAEILTLVARGLSGRDVAQRLSLSLHTVNTHLRNCHAKLDARNRQQAVNRARERGQIG